MSRYGHYFASDPDWESFMGKNPGYALKTDPHQVLHLDINGDRAAQLLEETQWAADHPLESFGYKARLESVRARDGYLIPIKVYHPLKAVSLSRLPLLFVTHGGGWVQGSFITEETWLLYPILQEFQFTIVSVDYRLAPEHKYPCFINDCWDTLQNVLKRSEELGFDPDRLYTAGSSAGGCTAAALAQMAYRANLPLKGAILNVPVTCHPDYFPADQYEYTSYDQCFGTLLGSSEMKATWDVVVPNREDGKKPEVSPMLGEVEGLPPHLIFIAGQDPLRDEGLAYADKLKAAGVNVRLHIYPGVPHTFSEIAELQMTTKFHEGLISSVREMLEEDAKVERDRFQEDTTLECGKCHQKNISYTQAQTRSADEPMIMFCECMDCGHRWKWT